MRCTQRLPDEVRPSESELVRRQSHSRMPIAQYPKRDAVWSVVGVGGADGGGDQLTKLMIPLVNISTRCLETSQSAVARLLCATRAVRNALAIRCPKWDWNR